MAENKDICLDISEIINFSRHSNCVSGIQRVIIELAKELQEDKNVRFVFLDDKEGEWKELQGINYSGIENLSIFNKISTSWKVLRIGWKEFLRQFKSERLLFKIRLLTRFVRNRTIRKFYDEVSVGKCLVKKAKFSDNEILLVPSIPKDSGRFYLSIKGINKKTKIVYFFHDIIPVSAPEFTGLADTKNFEKYIKLMDDTASLLITSAKFNIKVYTEYVRKHTKNKIGYEIKAIGLPVQFDSTYKDSDFDKISSVGKRLIHYKYCLVVGSVGPRKNHFEIIQAWRKYYESPDYNNEILVVAGAAWPSAPDIVDLLRSHICNGSVIYIESPSDQELAYLYNHCKFTICASLYEGWGLPVSESISVGKPVVILNSTTLPEAGYGVANVVETRNLKEMQEMIRRMFCDENYYKESAKKVLECRKNLPTWKTFKNSIVDCCNSL